ncbi:hypothetical protein ACQ4PT_040549 [Festuca glaucescens]
MEIDAKPLQASTRSCPVRYSPPPALSVAASPPPPLPAMVSPSRFPSPHCTHEEAYSPSTATASSLIGYFTRSEAMELNYVSSQWPLRQLSLANRISTSEFVQIVRLYIVCDLVFRRQARCFWG